MIVLLLDIDGPLNASRSGWQAPPRSGYAYAHGLTYRIRWEPRSVTRLRALHDTGKIGIRWCTTWVDNDVTQIERLVGFPPLPLAFPPDPDRPYSDSPEEHRSRYRAAKLGAALAVIRAGDRLIWVDDDAIPTTGPDRAALDTAGALLIAPEKQRGLRPEDIDTIEAYTRAATPPA